MFQTRQIMQCATLLQQPSTPSTSLVTPERHAARQHVLANWEPPPRRTLDHDGEALISDAEVQTLAENRNVSIALLNQLFPSYDIYFKFI